MAITKLIHREKNLRQSVNRLFFRISSFGKGNRKTTINSISEKLIGSVSLDSFERVIKLSFAFSVAAAHAIHLAKSSRVLPKTA